MSIEAAMRQRGTDALSVSVTATGGRVREWTGSEADIQNRPSMEFIHRIFPETFVDDERQLSHPRPVFGELPK